jgi:hypothetical protein
MTTVELDEDLYATIEELAKLREVPPALLIQQMLRSQLYEARQLPPDSQRNWDVFRSKLPELLLTHTGQCVAIADGHILGFSTDRIALLKDMRARYGHIHILVTEVTPHLRVRHVHYRKTLH